jgi:hypothetical protein
VANDYFSFFSSHTKIGNQPLEDLARYGYKISRQVAKSKNTTRCWQTNLIYQLNMAISKEMGYKYF